jgi:epoxide hydrolase
MADMTPFAVTFAAEDIDELRQRLTRTRWPEKETVSNWSQGLPLAFAQELASHWRDGYDFEAATQRMNTWPQFKTRIDGTEIHFVHARSPHTAAMPLIITHGWPGTFVEFLDVIGPLTDPLAHGGDAADEFHVVCPSLPGFGFSERPSTRGRGIPRIADAWSVLMRSLGYQRYGAQGGDWGSAI